MQALTFTHLPATSMAPGVYAAAKDLLDTIFEHIFSSFDTSTQHGQDASMIASYQVRQFRQEYAQAGASNAQVIIADTVSDEQVREFYLEKINHAEKNEATEHLTNILNAPVSLTRISDVCNKVLTACQQSLYSPGDLLSVDDFEQLSLFSFEAPVFAAGQPSVTFYPESHVGFEDGHPHMGLRVDVDILGLALALVRIKHLADGVPERLSAGFLKFSESETFLLFRAGKD